MPTFYAIKAGTQVDNLRGADPRGLETMISKHAGPNPPVPPLPEEAETAKTEGNKLFGQGKWQEAVEAYSRAIQHAPKSPHLRANRSLAYLKIGTDEMRPKAMQDALDATAFDERWAKGWVRLADVMVAEADNCKSKGGKLAEGYKKGLEAAQEALENALALAEEQGLNSQVTEIRKKLNEVNDKVENT
jgi:thioredoxin-like negative regulator of GroEL